MDGFLLEYEKAREETGEITLFHESTGSAVKRDEVLKILRAHKKTLAERFGVAELAIFGSFARDEATAESDVDILVHFDGPPHWRHFFDTQFYIEDLLCREVELVTDKALREELRPYIEKDMIRV